MICNYSLILSVIALIILYLTPIYGFKSRSLSRSTLVVVHAAKLPSVPPSLTEEIKKYLEKRPDTSYSGKVVSLDAQATLEKEVAAPENDIVPELKQTGWFRDPREVDERKRFDKTVPLVSHPLSYRELEKYGCGDLVKPILDLGGPYVVGSAIGIDWVDPSFEVDESKRPERKESYAMDMDANLGLGGSLNTKLEKAAEMDLGQLKREMETKKEAEKEKIKYISPSMRSRLNKEPMDYSRINEPYRERSSAVVLKEKKDNIFTKYFSRKNILALSLCSAFAYGRCTTEAAALLHMDGTAAVTAFQVMNIAFSLAFILKNLSSFLVTPEVPANV